MVVDLLHEGKRMVHLTWFCSTEIIAAQACAVGLGHMEERRMAVPEQDGGATRRSAGPGWNGSHESQLPGIRPPPRPNVTIAADTEA
jgi:hypothetical protein